MNADKIEKGNFNEYFRKKSFNDKSRQVGLNFVQLPT